MESTTNIVGQEKLAQLVAPGIEKRNGSSALQRVPTSKQDGLILRLRYLPSWNVTVTFRKLAENLGRWGVRRQVKPKLWILNSSESLNFLF